MRIILISIIFCLSSCNNKQNISKDINRGTDKISISKKNIEIENILKRQLEAGIYLEEAGLDPTSKYNYSFEDYNAINDELMKNLKHQSFNPKNFEEKILRVFNIKSNNSLVSVVIDSSCPPNTVIFYTSDDGSGIMSSYKPLQVDFKRKALLEAFYIPEIIDYQKKYPDMFLEERKLPREILLDETFYTVRRWMDDSNLSQKRQKNIQTVINRNKYLFNDSKASLVWLKFNDEYFLESLVKVFGYMEDKDLLKWVLDRNLKEEEFEKMLYTKTCDNKYVFHKEIFEVMTQADDKSKKEYLLFLKGRIDFPKLDDLNFSEAAKIEALYCYYATKFAASIERGDVYAFFPKLNDPKFEEEFRKNNYYNIPDFKKLYDDTKNGGIGLPM